MATIFFVSSARRLLQNAYSAHKVSFATSCCCPINSLPRTDGNSASRLQAGDCILNRGRDRPVRDIALEHFPSAGSESDLRLSFA
jgi:hypothetical protein